MKSTTQLLRSAALWTVSICEAGQAARFSKEVLNRKFLSARDIEFGKGGKVRSMKKKMMILNALSLSIIFCQSVPAAAAKTSDGMELSSDQKRQTEEERIVIEKKKILADSLSRLTEDDTDLTLIRNKPKNIEKCHTIFNQLKSGAYFQFVVPMTYANDWKSPKTAWFRKKCPYINRDVMTDRDFPLTGTWHWAGDDFEIYRYSGQSKYLVIENGQLPDNEIGSGPKSVWNGTFLLVDAKTCSKKGFLTAEFFKNVHMNGTNAIMNHGQDFYIIKAKYVYDHPEENFSYVIISKILNNGHEYSIGGDCEFSAKFD